MKKIISYIFAIILFVSCNKKESSLGDQSLLRYVRYTHPSELNETLSESFIYNDGILKTVIGNSSLKGSYESNELGQITKVTSNNKITTYEYYEDGKLKERNDFIGGINQNTPVKFSYSGLLVTAILERENPFFDNKIEFTLNNSGKVIRKRTFTEDNSGYKELFSETFSYETNGNITVHNLVNIIDPSQNSTTNYSYYEFKNPYYYAFKETYNSIYLDFFFNSFTITNKIGFSPNLQENNRIVYKENNGFPTKSTHLDTNHQIEYSYY